MAYWLFKSEPFKWSWEMQKAKGEAGEEWDGIRNYQARNFMREMKIGDLGLGEPGVELWINPVWAPSGRSSRSDFGL